MKIDRAVNRISNSISLGLFVCLSSVTGTLAFDIVIVPGVTLAGNPAALAAVERAAAAWEARISDSITVTIDVDLASFGNPYIIGTNSIVKLQAPYNTIRNAMVADAGDEPDDLIVSSLPTAAQFTGTLPAGYSFSGDLQATKANLKALGFPGLDGDFGASDGTITFNSNFAFDFDNSDGVTPGTLDLQTVVTHEIGHILGFDSVVDEIDSGTSPFPVTPMTLDLFRFRNGSAQDPATSAEFTTFARDHRPGTDAITDDIANEYRMSTGLNTGDGRQANHWKDDSITGTRIGVMDPTLSPGAFYSPSDADFRALDLIGYEVAPPVTPFTLSLTTSGSGTVSKSPDQANYESNSVVTLTATANPGWSFGGWTGDASGTNNPLSVTMTNNKVVTANFTNPVTIRWSTLDGGGGTSTNGTLTVRGTIGQHDAGRLSGGVRVLNGGFWGLIAAVQTPGSPLLTITLNSQLSTINVSWSSPSTGFVLQQNTTGVSSVNWSNVVTTPSDDGTTKTVIVNPPTGNRFYRLFRP